jgi:hypothetical protein
VRNVLPTLMMAAIGAFSGGASKATAQTGSAVTPCGIALPIQPPGPPGLVSVAGGSIVYDSDQGLCWLADANLAGRPDVRAAMILDSVNPDGVTSPVINPDGTMSYQTALNWVNALNHYNNGKGWLNHNNWQLPTNPAVDTTCSSHKDANFGVQCTGSALGHLYNVGLAKTYPDSVVPRFFSIVWPFLNLQPGLYWTSDPNTSGGASPGGETTFSFNTGIRGGNTTTYNFFRVLPMTKTVLGPVPVGSGVRPYLSGPAAGRAVYDTKTGVSWAMDANLPAVRTFGVTSTTTITSSVNGDTLTVPVVDKDGAVHFSAVDPANTTSGWIVSMNEREYAGTTSWSLPSFDDLHALYKDLGLSAGDTRLEWLLPVGPFQRLQPGFYWACVAATADRNGLCDLGQSAPGGLEWSFDFDDGFEGTDLPNKEFYVMVYFPAP